MVYEKNKSGDPDYDDKQPPEFHAGGPVVSAGDGVRIFPSTGPVDSEGAHVNLAVGTEDLDRRPSPGNVAKDSSTVQDYLPEDTPTTGSEVEADSADVQAIKDSQASVQAANLASSGVPVDTGVDEPSATQPVAPAKTTTSKSTTAK